MKYYYEDEFEKRIDWEDEELLDEELDEELLNEDYEIIEYEYGLDENDLKRKLAPNPKENPSDFSKTAVYKLQDIAKKYKFLTIGLRTKVKPGAKLFYTIRFWWVNRDRSQKKLVDWTIYGPTDAYYINIPVEDIIGVYRAKGYQMSSDIFLEYRADEEGSFLGSKWLERRDAIANFTSENKKISEDDFRKIQQGKPSDIGGVEPKPKYEGFFGGVAQVFDSILRTIIIVAIVLAILVAIYIFIRARAGKGLTGLLNKL